MVRVAPLVLVVAALGGCPSGSRGGGGTGPGTSSVAAGPDAGVVAPAPADAATSAALSEAECNRLIDHVVDVRLTQMRVERAPDEVPTDAQVAKIRETLGAEMMPVCREAFDRAIFDCMLAATAVDALYACVPAA